MPKSDDILDLSSDPTRLPNLRKLIRAFSHDLRTPLTVLKGDIEVSLLRERGPGEYREVLRSNLEEIDRMSRLLEDLVILVRAEIGDLQISFQPIDLAEIFAGLFSAHQIKAAEKGVQFRLESSDQIPVKADPSLARIVFSYVLENAVQYSPHGGEIRVSLEKDETEARVLIRDQGIGIAPEEREHVFEPFFRGAQARELYENGHGLGLAVCKKIIFAHNGSIEIETGAGPGKGAVFKIRLPIRAGKG